MKTLGCFTNLERESQGLASSQAITPSKVGLPNVVVPSVQHGLNLSDMRDVPQEAA
jgi:hypothetical protein